MNEGKSFMYVSPKFSPSRGYTPKEFFEYLTGYALERWHREPYLPSEVTGLFFDNFDEDVMSKEIALIPAGTKSDELMKMIGQGAMQDGPQWPFMRINRLSDDDDGNTLPVGTFFLHSKQLNDRIYGKPAFFRPFLNRYQYARYDAGTEKYTNWSIMFGDFNEDIPDQEGTFKCGKVAKKNLDSLTPEQAAAQKEIKCFRYLFGLITLEGVTPKGEKVRIDNEPAIWRSTGLNFMPVGEVLEGLRRQKKFMFNYTIRLETERQKRGSNVFYVAVPSLVDADPVPFLQSEMDLLQEFIGYVNNTNDDIWEKHQSAVAKKPGRAEIIAVKEITDARPLDADFDDPISDVSA